MKTSARDFEKFKIYCRKWADLFGLKDYHFTFRHVKGDRAAYGGCLIDFKRRTARISLYVDWGKGVEVTEEELDRTALHEILHVVLDHLTALAEVRYVVAGDIEMAQEAAIVRLENGIYPLVRSARVKNG